MPGTFDARGRLVTLSLPDREGQHARFRWRPVGTETWNFLPDNLDAVESFTIGPDAVEIEAEAQIVYANGTSDENWARFCDNIICPALGLTHELGHLGFLSGEDPCPDDSAYDPREEFINPVTGDVLTRTEDLWPLASVPTWDPVEKRLSANGNLLKINDDGTVTFTQGRYNAGVVWRSEDMTPASTRGSTTFRNSNAVWNAMTASLFEAGHTNPRFSRLQFTNDTLLEQISFRFFTRSDEVGSGAEGPHFNEPIANFFLVVKWGNEWFRCEFDATDMLEPYGIDTNGIPLRLRQLVTTRALADDRLGAVDGGVSIALCRKDAWPYLDKYYHATGLLPLQHALAAVQGDYDSDAVQGYKEITGEAADFDSEGIGLIVRNDNLNDVFFGFNLDMPSELFVGDPTTVTLNRVRLFRDSNVWVANWSQTGGQTPALKADARNYTIVFSINGVVSYAQFRGDDLTLSLNLVGDGILDAAVDIRDAPSSLIGRNTAQVAIVDRRNWEFDENATDYARAFLPDEAFGEWVWPFNSLSADDVSPVTVAGHTPNLLGTRLRMIVLDYREQCWQPRKLRYWQLDRSNVLGQGNRPGFTDEFLETLCRQVGEVTDDELPGDNLAYGAPFVDGEDVGFFVPDENGRKWNARQQQTTAEFPIRGFIKRRTPGLPEIGAVPGEDWTGWEPVVYQRTFGRDAVQLVMSSGSVEVNIPEPVGRRTRVFTETKLVLVKVAVLVGGRPLAKESAPPFTDLTIEGDILDYRLTATNGIDVLDHPDDAIYEFYVEFTAASVIVGRLARTFTRRLEITMPLFGEDIKTVPSQVLFIATKEGAEQETAPPPRSATARNITANSVTVHWRLPDSTLPLAEEITAMEVVTETDTTVFDTEKLSATASMLKVTGLRAGRYYHFNVYSLIERSDGTVLRSAPATVSAQTTGTMTPTANAPRNLSSDNVTTSGYRLRWAPPTGGPTVTGYTHKVREGREDGRVVQTDSLRSSARSDTISDLNQGTTYVSELTANSASGDSDSVFLAVETTAEGPNAPRNLRASLRTADGMITFDWDPPTVKAEAPVTQFEITALQGVNTVATRRLAANTTRATLSGFLAATEYDVRVWAYSNRRRSSPILITFTTRGAKTELPSLSIASVRITSTTLLVTVNALHANADSWALQIAPTSQATFTNQPIPSNGKSLLLFIDDLTTGTEYKLRARQVARGNNATHTTGPWGPEFTATPNISGKEPLDWDSGVRASASGRTITVNTNALPTGAVGLEVRYKERPSDFVGWFTKERQGATVTSITLDDDDLIEYNQEYQLAVRALARDSDPTNGDSEWSDTIFVTTEKGTLGAITINNNIRTTPNGLETEASVFLSGMLPDGATGWQAQFATDSDFANPLPTSTTGITDATANTFVTQITRNLGVVEGTIYARARAFSTKDEYQENGPWTAAVSGTGLIRLEAPTPTLTSTVAGRLTISVTGVSTDPNNLGWQYEYAKIERGIRDFDFSRSPVGTFTQVHDGRTSVDINGLEPGPWKVQVRQSISSKTAGYGPQKIKRAFGEVIARTTGTKLSTPTGSNVGQTVRRQAGTGGQSGPSGQQQNLPTDKAWQVRAAATADELPTVEPLTVRGENNELPLNLPFPFAYQIRDHAVDDNFRDSDWTAPITVEEQEAFDPPTVTAAGGVGTIAFSNVSLPFGVTSWRRRYAQDNDDLDGAEVLETTGAVVDMAIEAGSWFVQVQSVGDGVAADSVWLDLPTVVVQEAQVPAQPVFANVSFGANNLTASWAAVAGATGFVANLYVNGYETEPVQTRNLSAAARTVEFSGLMANTTYYIGLVAVNAQGNSLTARRSGNTLAAAVSRPNPPVNLVARFVTNENFHISWAPGPAVAGRNVTRWRVVGAGVDEFVTFNTYSFSRLRFGTTYDIDVYAYSGDVASFPSRISVTTAGAVTQFATPVVSVEGNANGFSVSVEAPTAVNGTTPDNWELDYGLAEGTSQPGYPIPLLVYLLTHDITATPGTVGYVRARFVSKGNIGASPWSAWVSATSGGKLPTPARIGVEVGSKSATIRSLFPPDILSSIQWSLRVRYATTEAGLATGQTAIAAAVENAAVVSLTGLTDGQQYHIEAQYVSSSAEDSDYGARTTFTPVAPATGIAASNIAVTNIRLFDGLLNGVAQRVARVRVTMTLAGMSADNFVKDIEFTANSNKWVIGNSQSFDRTSYTGIVSQTRTALDVQLIYFAPELPDNLFVNETVNGTLTIGTRNTLASSDAEVDFSFATTTDLERGPQTANVTSIDQVAHNTARVNWTLAADANTHAPLGSFAVEARIGAAVISRTTVTNTAATNAVVSGLSPSTRYEFAVVSLSPNAVFQTETTGTTMFATTLAPVITLTPDKEEVNIEATRSATQRTLAFSAAWTGITPVEVTLYSQDPDSQTWTQRDQDSTNPTSPTALNHVVATSAVAGVNLYRLGWKETSGGTEQYTDPIGVYLHRDYEVAIEAADGRLAVFRGATEGVRIGARFVPPLNHLQLELKRPRDDRYYSAFTRGGRPDTANVWTGTIRVDRTNEGKWFSRWQWRRAAGDDFSYSREGVYQVVNANNVLIATVLSANSITTSETATATVTYSNPSTVNSLLLRIDDSDGNLAARIQAPSFNISSPVEFTINPIVHNLRPGVYSVYAIFTVGSGSPSPAELRSLWQGQSPALTLTVT